jgi:hypothetical protein
MPSGTSSADSWERDISVVWNGNAGPVSVVAQVEPYFAVDQTLTTTSWIGAPPTAGR